MVVVPVDSHLEIEAMVSNCDIGFIHVGQDVEIKVATFNFTRYGLIHGKVLSIWQDAITRDKPQDKSNDQTPGAATNASEPSLVPDFINTVTYFVSEGRESVRADLSLGVRSCRGGVLLTSY